MSNYNKIEVKLLASQLTSDLDAGLAWLKSEDEYGKGSIQEKYDVTAQDIEIIRTNPPMAGKKPTVRIIQLVNDLQPAKTTASKAKAEQEPVQTELPIAEPVAAAAPVAEVSNTPVAEAAADNESAQAFFAL